VSAPALSIKEGAALSYAQQTTRKNHLRNTPKVLTECVDSPP